jgi:hypothetical protein
MQSLVVRSFSLLSLASGLAAQAIITPTVNDPNFGATIISTDFGSNSIQRIEQIEMRHLGSGVYRTVVTAKLAISPDTKLVAGFLNLSTNPPTWVPTDDLEALNVNGTATDEFQGSLSADGLTVVWDNYVATSYPNTGGTGTSFICRRASTSVQFSVNDVRLLAGAAAGGVDPHIAQEVGTNVLVTYIDFAGSSGIIKCVFDPVTGAQVGAPSQVVTGSPVASFQFCHSPWANRDSTGKPVALGYSEYHNTTGAPSDALWVEDLDNTGTPNVVIPGTSGGVATWYANPTVLGGTFVHACARGGYIDPTVTECSMVANADLTGGPGTRRVVGFAPVRPRANGTFISAVGIGANIPLGPTPPVIGNIEITPIIGILPIVFHNIFTGEAEWVFGNFPTLNQTWYMQIVTLDTAAGLIYAGNVATVRI